MKLPIIFSIIMILLVWFVSTTAPEKYPIPTHEAKVNLNQPSIDYWEQMQERFVVIEAREVKTWKTH